MTGLLDDARTRGALSAGGLTFSPGNARQVRALLGALHGGEVVEHFLENAAGPDGSDITALTSGRLIAVSGYFRARVRTVSRPLRARLRRVPIDMVAATLPTHDGTRLELLVVSPEDVRALVAAGATAPRPRKADRRRPSPAPKPAAGPPPGPAPAPGPAPKLAVAFPPRPAPKPFAGPTTRPAPVTARGFAAAEPVRTWRDAERVAVDHMRHLGFGDARQTRHGADDGLDVVSSQAAAQVKYHRGNAIGSPAVRDLVGAAHQHPVKLFYSRSGYTAAARRYAEESGVYLFRLHDSGEVEPENVAARTLAQTGAALLNDPVAQQQMKSLRAAEEAAAEKQRKAEVKHDARCRDVAARVSSLRKAVRPQLQHRSRRKQKQAALALATLQQVAETITAARTRKGDLAARQRRVEDAEKQVRALARSLGVKLR